MIKEKQNGLQDRLVAYTAGAIATPYLEIGNSLLDIERKDSFGAVGVMGSELKQTHAVKCK